MDKTKYVNRSFGEAAATRAIMEVLRPLPYPDDGPFLRKDLKNLSKAGEFFEGQLARLLRARFIDEIRVVTYELVSRPPMPDDLTEHELDIVHVLRVWGVEWMWYDLNTVFDSTVPYSAMLKLMSRGIVKSKMGFAYAWNKSVRM